MDFALPASLFVATALTRRETLLAQWPLLAVLTASMLVLYAISWWMQRRLFKMAPGEASVQALTIALPNYLAGLPLIPAVFGEADSIFVALAIAAGSIVTSPLTLAILEAQKTVAARRKQNAGALLAAVGRSFREPIVLGPIVGIVFALIGIPLAPFVAHAFQLIGEAAGGVALFLTGLILSAQWISLGANVLSGTLLKNVVHPLLAYALILILPMQHDTAHASLLLVALPSGFFGVLFGLRYGLESETAGATLIVSSLASIVTLAAALLLTAGW